MAVILVAVPFTGLLGYGLTFIKDKHFYQQMLPGNVKKVTRVIETNKIARIFAGIFSFGLTELMNHSEESVEYFYEDEFIGSNEKEAAEELYNKGNKFYKREDYETAAMYFARACDLAEHSGNINETYRESLKRVKQKIKEEAERREYEEAEREEAMRREREEAAKKKREAERWAREQAMRREREEAAKRKQEAERQAREEALRLERARAQSKSLLEDATYIFQQAEALNCLELKLEKYETALSKCEESCASNATEVALNTLNKIFESCLKHDAWDEAEVAVQIVRKYFPNEAGRLQNVLVNQQNDYESRARRQQEQQEQHRTVLITFT